MPREITRHLSRMMLKAGYPADYFQYRFRFNGREELTTEALFSIRESVGNVIRAATSLTDFDPMPITSIEILPIVFLDPVIISIANGINVSENGAMLLNRLLKFSVDTYELRSSLNKSQFDSALKNYGELFKLCKEAAPLLLLFQEIIFGPRDEERPLRYVHLQDVIRMGIDKVNHIVGLLTTIPSRTVLEIMEDDAVSIPNDDLQSIVIYALNNAKKEKSLDYYVMALKELGRRSFYNLEWKEQFWNALFKLPHLSRDYGWRRGLFGAYFRRTYLVYPGLFRQFPRELCFALGPCATLQSSVFTNINFLHLLTVEDEPTLGKLEEFFESKRDAVKTDIILLRCGLIAADFFISTRIDLNLPILPRAIKILHKVLDRDLEVLQTEQKLSKLAILNMWNCRSLMELFLSRDSKINLTSMNMPIDIFAVILKYHSNQHPSAEDWMWFYKEDTDLEALAHEYYQNRHWIPNGKVVVLSISKRTTELPCMDSSVQVLRGLAYLLFDIPFEVSDVTNIDDEGDNVTFDPLDYESFFAAWQSLMEFRLGEEGRQNFALLGLTVKFAFPELEIIGQYYKDVIEIRRQTVSFIPRPSNAVERDLQEGANILEPSEVSEHGSFMEIA